MESHTDAHNRPAGPSPNRLTLVIPAFNEQETIRQAVLEADAALARCAAAWEIIVVDDGSTDSTAAIVRAEAAGNPRVRLVEQPANLGYGAALRAGFRAATMELVAFTDADCQFDLADLEYVLPLASRYDVVCGYRIERQDAAHRRFCACGYNTLVSLLLGVGVRDVDCALKVFRRAQLAAIMPESDNFVANAELLTRARLGRLSVVEVGVRHRPRAAGRSKVSLREVPGTLATLLPFWWSRVLFAAGRPQVSRDAWFWPALLLLALVAGLLLFSNLSYPLIEPDEGRYAEIAREMLIGGDWVVPHLNREPYLDKPPLLYWLMASSFHCFGTTEWAARLTPASAALATLIITFLFGRRTVGTRAALFGCLTMTLSIGFVHSGRLVILDSLFSLWVSAALAAAYIAIDRVPRQCHRALNHTGQAEPSWLWWLASAICCGLGALTKGPVAFLLVAPPVIAHVCLSRSVRPTARHWLAFAALALAVAGPWYGAIAWQRTEFAQHFFWKHHIERFFGETLHPKPAWFYLPVLLVGGLPWSLLVWSLGKSLLTRTPAMASVRPASLGYLVLWAGWCVLFFSLGRGKLPAYILPALPALSLVLGWHLEHVLFDASPAEQFRRAREIVPRFAVASLGICGVVVAVTAWHFGLDGATACSVQIAVSVAVVAAAVFAFGKLSPPWAWSLCGLFAAALVCRLSLDLVPAWARARSPLVRSREIAELLADDRTAVACYGREWGSISFYLGRDDVWNFSRKPRHELAEFLSQHQRTLLVIKGTAELDWFRSAVPSGMQMTRLRETPEFTVGLVHAAPTLRAN